MDWLKRQLNKFALLLGLVSPPPPIAKPDLSLIRDYERDLQTKETGYQGAYIAHFHKANKHLYYVAAAHELGPDNETFRAVREVLTKKPQLIVLEGFPTDKGLSPDFYKEYVTQKAADNFRSAEEPQYTAYLALQNNIPFMGGEPTDKEIFQAMNQKGYSDKDVAAFYLLRWIPRWVEQQGITEKNFDQKAQDYLDHFQYYQDNSIPPDQRLTVPEFKAWYAEHNDQPSRPFLHINTENLAPVRSQFASYFEKMSADTGEIRERHLDTLIGKSLNENDRVLVVYGGGHLVQSRKVFENMFGQSETIKLR